MVEREFFSHDLPGGGTVFDVLSRRRYCFRLAGENIGWNTWADVEATRGIHGMFLGSPGHRQNVVGAAWDAIGVGAFKGPDGRKVWTVLFADACGRTPPSVPTGAAAPTAGPEPRPSPDGAADELSDPRTTGAGSARGVGVAAHAGILEALGWLGAAVVEIVQRMVTSGTGAAAAR